MAGGTIKELHAVETYKKQKNHCLVMLVSVQQEC